MENIKMQRYFTSILCLLCLFVASNLQAQYTGTGPYCHESGGLFINELSNGTGGFDEYVELIVTGDPDDPTAPVDLTGWIMDDNNVAAPNQGNAPGHVFLGDCYNAVPPGSIMVIYNEDSPNPVLPPDDPFDNNPPDGVYIIPHRQEDCVTVCSSNPNSGFEFYCPCQSEFSVGWQFNLRNEGDGLQIRDNCATLSHFIYWGGIEISPLAEVTPVHFSIGLQDQGQRVINFVNTVDDNWHDPANFENVFASTGQTPGQPNNPANADLINRIANGTFSCEGTIWDCNDTDAGDIDLPSNANTIDPPIELCLGEDLGPFLADYSAADEMEPDAVGFDFEYAFILTESDDPIFTFVDFDTQGDFDFSVLDTGTYVMWGFSFLQANGLFDVLDFLNADTINSIADILAYGQCGFSGDLTNENINGIRVDITITDVIDPALPANFPQACESLTGTATFDLTSLDDEISGGQGMVNWYLDIMGVNAIPDPTNFTTVATTVFASVINNGCESETIAIPIGVSESIEISAIIEAEISCFGEDDGIIDVPITGGSGPFDYDWNLDELDGQPKPNSLGPGTYSVTVTDASGCSDTASVMIIEPALLELTAQGQDISCFGAADGQVSAEAIGGTPMLTYSWSTGDNLPEISNLSAGDYAITVTDGRGCEETTLITIVEPGPINFTTSTIDPTCFVDQNGLIIIDTISGGVGPFQLTLDDEAPQTVENLPYVFSGLGGGDYLVAIEDANNCSFSNGVTVNTPPELVIDLGDDLFIRIGDSVLLNPFINFEVDSFAWSPITDTLLVNSLEGVLFPTESVVYTLIAFDSTGCLVTEDLAINVDRTRRIFIPNAFSPDGSGRNDGFTVYSDFTVVEIELLQIFDRWGNLVFERRDFPTNDESLGWDGTFRGEEMNTGVFVYLAQIQFSDNEVETFSGDVLLLR